MLQLEISETHDALIEIYGAQGNPRTSQFETWFLLVSEFESFISYVLISTCNHSIPGILTVRIAIMR